MKTSAEPVPLIVVGGGSILVREVEGMSELIRPDHFEAAYAVGADPRTIEIVGQEDVPLAYLPKCDPNPREGGG